MYMEVMMMSYKKVNDADDHVFCIQIRLLCINIKPNVKLIPDQILIKALYQSLAPTLSKHT